MFFRVKLNGKRIIVFFLIIYRYKNYYLQTPFLFFLFFYFFYFFVKFAFEPKIYCDDDVEKVKG